MAVDFRGHPMFPSTGFNAPTRFEADIYDCEVWGRIPSDIEGNFYRMQCDFQLQAEPQACLVSAALWPDACGDCAPGTAPLDAADPVDRHWVG